MVISSQDIRNIIKPYDGWFYKVSNTKVILDWHFDEVSVDDVEKFGDLSLDCIVSIFKKSDPIKYKDLTRETLYTTFKTEIRDCDNFAQIYVALFKLFWSLDNDKEYEPALFRTIIKWGDGSHAIAGFYYRDRIKMLDPQIDQWIENKKILAVA